ncbi:MAG: hypothetical protein IPK26_01155 [Planctomycetes bacterium]|nr:hypothetical protein [Planctomycetota bacterium]
MMPGWRQTRREFSLRWIWDSPLQLVFLALLLLGAGTAARIAAALRSAATTRATAAVTWAALVAEEAALQLAARPSVAPGLHVVRTAVADVQVEVDAEQWRLTVSLPDGHQERFWCSWLPGAAHPAFAQAWTSARSDRGVVCGAAAPVYGPLPALAPVKGSAPPSQFVRDAGVALRHLTAGTDRVDYRLDIEAPIERLDAAGVVEVPGNLWIDAGTRPLHVELTQDLTVLVRGNVYLGRSIAVTGPGRLLLAAVAQPGELVFVDRDANGRWSDRDDRIGPTECGPLEGAGAVWIGLPGQGQEPMSLQVGLFAAGPVHLLAERAEVAGCVLAGAGVHGLGGERELTAMASRWFDLDREAVPGFLSAGCPRPGRLFRVDESEAPPRQETVAEDRDEGLYAAWSGR